MRSLFPVVLLGFGLFVISPSPVAAAPRAERAYSVKEEVSSPRGWVKHSRPDPNHNIVLRIGLPQLDFHVLEKNLYEVSDPDHQRYGQHLSKAEVEALVAPHPESIELVNEWLGTFGVNEDSLVRSPARDWVTLKVPVSLAEKMLDTVSCLNLATWCFIHDFCRPITSGNILRVGITWSGLRTTVFLATFMTISTSFNPQRCSEDSRKTNRQLSG